MKGIFTKKITIKTAIAYLVFEKEQERPDIVRFLKGEEFENETINTRVKEYLSKLHIINRDGSITEKGDRVVKTGKLFIQEEGKYKIWFTENDNFLDTKILYFERKSPRNGERIDEININFEEDNYFLPIKNDGFSLLKLVDTDNISGQINHNSQDIELVWKWNDSEKSSFHFFGKIDKNTIKEHQIESNENLEEYILKIFPDWDYANKKLKVEFRNLSNDAEKRKFKIDYKYENQAGFDKIEFTDIPIIPYNKQDAIKWRNWFINQEIEKEYFLKYDFEKLVNEINNKNGFSTYKDDLDIPEISEYRKVIYSNDRSKQSPAFWHLSAPDDLNPDADEKFILDKISIEPGKQISFLEISEKLLKNTRHKINTVLYYDKYVKNTKQQKAMIAFFEAISASNNYLITDLKGDRGSLITKNNKIKEIDIRDVFKKERYHHDRYVILIENKDKYTVWRLSNSIDYIRFNNADISPKTKGKMIDNIVFLNVEKEMLKQELRTFIENKL